MAKITSKIKIADYDIVNNRFNLSFQLAPGVKNDLIFIANYGKEGLRLDLDSEETLGMLGFTDTALERVLDEIVSWLSKSQVKLGNVSPGGLMNARIETVTETSDPHNARGKTEAQRIAMEAPCLDWAMSAVGEMESLFETGDVVFTVPLREPDATINDACVVIWANLTNDFSQVSDGIIKRGYETICHIADGYRSQCINPVHEAQKAIGKLKLMEAAILDEAPARELDAPIIDYVMGRMSLGLGVLAEKIRPEQEICMREAIRAGLKLKPIPASVRPTPLPVDAIQSATDTIHRDLLRFFEPLTFREHDFVRAIIKEEIERVVGGVL